MGGQLERGRGREAGGGRRAAGWAGRRTNETRGRLVYETCWASLRRPKGVLVQ